MVRTQDKKVSDRLSFEEDIRLALTALTSSISFEGLVPLDILWKEKYKKLPSLFYDRNINK